MCVEFLNSNFLLFHYFLNGVVKFETDLNLVAIMHINVAIHDELTSMM